MGVVDRARSVHHQLVDATCKQRVLFHHVPKCGGTSVGRALRKRYILSQGTVLPEETFQAYRLFSGEQDREKLLVDVLDLREQMLLYLLFTDVRCVSAHVRYSALAYKQFGDRYRLVTMLREPVSRFVSHYYWSRSRQGHARIEVEFDEFLESERARRMGATYVEYFCGLEREVDLTSSAAIQAACENLLHFSVVGLLDDTETFENDIRRELGVKVHVGTENKASKSVVRKKAELSEDQLERVRALCRPDLEVYESVLAAKEA